MPNINFKFDLKIINIFRLKLKILKWKIPHIDVQ